MLKKVCAAAAIVTAVCVIAAVIWVLLPAEEVPSALESLDTGAEDVRHWDRVIAYVPLDDRTDNMEDVVYLAEASGYQILLPEGDIYCTKLDGQELNSNGTQYGDREALMTWVREMDEAGCDLFLLSMDQLFSGGLVNSRSVSGEFPLTFDDGTVMTETEAFDAYILSLAEDPDNRIYLYDSVVRLASTVAYQGFGTEEYYALRAYGMAARPALEGEELTLENVFAAYPYAADGATPAEDTIEADYRAVLTDGILENYLGVRMRKLALTDYVISALKTAEHDNIHLLIGIDDSSNTPNIQYNELHYIQRQLGRGSTLLTGLDSLARLLVCEIARDSYGAPQVRASVRYIGGSQGVPSSEFDRYTLEETVDLHMDLFQAVRVPEEEAELQFLVMTAPDDPARNEAYCEELLSKLEYNAQHRIPTALIEASNGAYGDALEQMLFDRVDFARLVAFAGQYEQANVTGAGMAMGFSRYLYLAHCREKDEACDVAHVRQITNSLSLTYPYSLHAQTPLNIYIRDLGEDYNNLLPGRVNGKLIQTKLEGMFLPACEAVSEAMEGGRVITSLSPYAEREVREVTVSDVYFPWNRTFEISFTISVALAED